MKPGDVCEVEIEGIGTLVNPHRRSSLSASLNMKAIQVHVPGGPRKPAGGDPFQIPVAGRGQVRVKASTIGVGRPDVLLRKGTYKWMPPTASHSGRRIGGCGGCSG